MLGNFKYSNPTKLYFGDEALGFLEGELANYGENVTLVYGGGSIKKNGLYDEVMAILKKAGKTISEISGVMPNPTIEKLREGINIAREAKTDLLLAVGGGSVCDFAKGVSASVNFDGDPWQHYYIECNEPECEVVPVACVLTMVGTGSEMNTGSVITNPEEKLKFGVVWGDDRMYPKFTILNPKYTLTLPEYQMVSGAYDIFSHICEQYFSGDDDNTSDYIAEGLMRSVVNSSRIAAKDPQNYEARSNLMWSATWALNSLIEKGKAQDWEVHMIGQAMGGVTDATHGMTLAAVSMPYYRYIMPYGLPKFKRFAEAVWNVNPEGKSDMEVAEEGLCAMENWMNEIGLVMHSAELGVTEENIPDIVKGTGICDGGYKVLDEAVIAQILKESM